MTFPIREIPHFGYTLEEDKYVLYNRGVRVFETEQVALLLDRHSGTLHKHGLPEYVTADFRRMTKGMRAGGFEYLADQLVVIEGRFPLEELNACLTIHGHVGKLYEQLLSRP